MLRRSITRANRIIAKDLTTMEMPTKENDQTLITKTLTSLNNTPKEEPIKNHCPSTDCNKSGTAMETAITKDSKEKSAYGDVLSDTNVMDYRTNRDDQTKFPCPVCNFEVKTAHEFTEHIRTHNNVDENEKDYTCKICYKMLSSNSSLDRHILVHSGEKPFRCRVCSVTFNTNGNMHRHMRSHDSSARTDSCESDGSTDSNSDAQSQRLENNNNRIAIKRKCDEEIINDVQNKRQFKYTDDKDFSSCPVCGKNDFQTTYLLEQHFESAHPDHDIECGKCELNFDNFRALHLHRFMKHKESDEGNGKPVVGFSDLTFVDFSAEKFPHIARAACELNVHKPANGSKCFECVRCSLAFPCASALEIHEKTCKSVAVSHKTSANVNTDDDVKREDFFATLNLQNKTIKVKSEEKLIDKDLLNPLITNNDNKDLADIQSIISMASAKALLKQLSTKPQEVPIQEGAKENPVEEEAQDLFSAEFRKMKLRGEFPCRLCTAVFPNLRALKGHNRLHLTGNGPGPYRCNMCPHSSTDKAALVRHMRTHNGDRPYECAICNYAFTTKANCERHLRNRHAKVTREEVKQSIIYHPSEDPNNDDLKRDQQINHVQTATPSIFGTPETDPESVPEHIPNDRSTPLSHLISQRSTTNLALPRDLSIVIPQCNLTTRMFEATQQVEKIPPQKIHVKSLEELSRPPSYIECEPDSEEDDYRPIDLSMDALDLSKKRKPEEKPLPVTPITSEPHDLSKNGLDFTAAMLQMAQQQERLKGPAANFYAAQLQEWYRGGFPLPPTAFSPFFLPPTAAHPFLTPPNNAQDIASMKELEKEIIRGLQLSGGSLIMNNMALASERLQAFQQQAFNIAVAAKTDKVPIINEDIKNPLLVNTTPPSSLDNSSPYSPNHHSPINKQVETSTPTSHSPGAVKMVIKNGVLMPKQKQRRYRTERPFSCEHCSARFTLRSNMERHVKQQHPQHWAQRQRSGGHVIRRGPVSQTISQVTNPIDNQNQPVGFNISDQVKYAILAQQLQRSELPPQRPEQDDEDVELVIDEEAHEEKPEIKEEPSNLTMNDNAKARKVANEILQQAKFMEATAGIKEKDFDLKIVSNLIPKSPMDLTKSDSFIPVATVKNTPLHLDGKLAQALSKKSQIEAKGKMEEADLASVSKLLDNANSQLPFGQFFRNNQAPSVDESEGEEEGLVASGSASEENNSGSDENKSESEQRPGGEKKKSAYSLAPNRVSCTYCHRKFPWSSSLRRHILTHTGQKPYKCAHCPLLFTTKSNCDRHLLRKHGHLAQQTPNSSINIENNQNAREEINSMGFITRNVPERPYKCSSCPSSTFSTISNLKKHMSCKHSNTSSSTEHLSGGSRPASPASENASDQNMEKKPKVTDWEAQIGTKTTGNENHHPSNVMNSDFPFKCHLCEGSYPERQIALDHIKDSHSEEYELLVSKGAMDAEQEIQNLNQHDDNEEATSEAGKGRFPDYANRKVICAFCMRRFWSAEDLRRHMRTHSGVRPFQCDVCRRRFTLKHSMLRHRKKHDSAQSRHSLRLRSTTTESESSQVENNGGMDSVSDTSDEEAKNTAVANGRPDGDLIGNLLGISDRGVLNKVLFSASAHEAAMLLGVDHRK